MDPGEPGRSRWSCRVLFIPLVNHGNVALDGGIGVTPRSSFLGFIGQGAEGALEYEGSELL